MPDQNAFTRKASGLVRGLSFLDAFGVGFMNQGLTPSMWVMISFGLGVYLGGNLIWATIISALFCGIGFSLVWGILGGSMARSGGEYIYNSRILHPIVGMAESFGSAFVWIMWIFVLAPYTVDPGLVMIFQFLDMSAAAEFMTQPLAVFIVATGVNLVGMLVVVFGVKVFARVQKVIMLFAILGTLAIILVFTFTTHETFIHSWNNLAAQYGSLDFEGFLTSTKIAIAETGKTLPSTWNWFDTLGVMVAGSWMFAYAYCITFIAGEVKRPAKTILLANLFAVLVPAAFMVWLSAALYRTVGFEFLSATAWVDNMGVEAITGYSLPWPPHFVGLAAIINQNGFLVFLMGLSYILFTLWWVALSYLAFPRILFAWGIDRMGPKWFANIDFRWASPVKNHILCFILAEIGILIYAFGLDPMAGLSVTGMEIVSVFGITAIAAAVFPFSKRAKAIWESSPYKNWKILGIPVVTIGAVLNLVYLGILFYFFFFMAEMGEQELVKGSLILYGIIWVLGIAWYFFWKARNKKMGVDTDVIYNELPPD